MYGLRGVLVLGVCACVCPSLSACGWMGGLYLCINRSQERRMRVSACACDSVRSAVDSAAVSSNAKDSKAITDSRSDPRAGRPRRYRPVRSARLRMRSSRLVSCVRTTLRADAVVFLCALCNCTHACVRVNVNACVRACVRVCVRVWCVRVCELQRVHACACMRV
jgi:hypothetical protein